MFLVWMFYVGLIIGLFILSRMIVKYYIDPAESYSFAVLSISISFTMSMICLLMVPIDVFVTSHPNEIMHTMHILINKYFIREVFLYLYVGLLSITFILLPFNYFYGEERALNYENDFDLDLSEKRLINKVARSAKSTLLFVLLIIIILLMGLILRPDQSVSYQRGKELEWVKSLFDVEHIGEQAIAFCISIILSLGSCLWFVYGSYGLSALPFYLIKGTKSLEEEKSEVNNDLARLRERYRAIQEKYARSHTKITKNDQKSMNNLKRKERNLNFKSEKIVELESQSKSLQTLFKLLSPFRVVIGVGSLIMSLTIVGSLAITTYLKIQNSNCGLKCGYLVEQKATLNPLDTLFVYSSYYFPLDYLLFVVFCLYIFICSLYGIIKCGINFLFMKGLDIRKESTQPTALFIMAFILNISIIVVCNQLMTLCPQYATFGNQHFNDIKTRSEQLCTLDAVSKVEARFICQMTNMSSFHNKMSVGFPLFAICFFMSNVAFLLFTAIFLIVFLFKQKVSQIEISDEQEYDDETSNLVNY